LIQNGFVFFFVLAVAAKILMRGDAQQHQSRSSSKINIRAYSAVGLAACLILSAYWSIRLYSSYLTVEANYTQDFDQATSLYTLASKLDDENPDARNNHGMRLFRKNDMPKRFRCFRGDPHWPRTFGGLFVPRKR
jgi:hypothetical protein